MVACGGGVVLEPANRITLRNTGVAVYLDVPSTSCAAGCSPPSDRPLIRQEGDLERLLTSRGTLYREFAGNVVDGSGEPGPWRRRSSRSSVGPCDRPDAGTGLRRDDRQRPPRRGWGAALPDLPGATTAFVISDRVVADLHHAALATAIEDRGLASVLLLVPPGEEAKSLQAYESLLRQLAGREAHRDDAIVALGGGAVGDLAGFVASTYMRGLPFIQVPTTLTAQVDAAIGGKTAVNLPEGKNLVGTFAQPRAVFDDVDVDDPRQAGLPMGLAEVAKIALTLDRSSRAARGRSGPGRAT